MSSRLGIKHPWSQLQKNIKEKYQEAYIRYTQGEFNYNTYCLIEKICQKAKDKIIQKKLFYLILMGATKLMHLNELQLLFLGATLEEMNWKFSSYDLSQQAFLIPPILARIPLNATYKKIEIQIFFLSYTIKKYLNEENQVTIYDYKIKDIFKIGFDKLYQEWFVSAHNYFKLNPKQMNNTFKQFNHNQSQNVSQIIDYNQMIDQLLKDSDKQLKQQYRIDNTKMVINMNNFHNNQLNSQIVTKTLFQNIIEQQTDGLPLSLSGRLKNPNLIKKGSSVSITLIKEEQYQLYQPQIINFKKSDEIEDDLA